MQTGKLLKTSVFHLAFHFCLDIFSSISFFFLLHDTETWKADPFVEPPRKIILKVIAMPIVHPQKVFKFEGLDNRQSTYLTSLPLCED